MAPREIFRMFNNFKSGENFVVLMLYRILVTANFSFGDKSNGLTIANPLQKTLRPSVRMQLNNLYLFNASL